MLIRGDARDLPLRDQTVQCVVTSPPYFRLRDYQGGPREIGRETTPEAYVAALAAVFREVRRVLRRDGVLWLVLGDARRHAPGQLGGGSYGLKRKDLIGLPWRVALALQADGWYLRHDIIWAKPDAMPEPVCDRPTRSHEYVFLLSKSSRYFYDAAAIAEPAVSDHPSGNRFRRRHRRPVLRTDRPSLARPRTIAPVFRLNAPPRRADRPPVQDLNPGALGLNSLPKKFLIRKPSKFDPRAF